MGKLSANAGTAGDANSGEERPAGSAYSAASNPGGDAISADAVELGAG